jgi:hypothetical protein
MWKGSQARAKPSWEVYEVSDEEFQGREREQARVLEKVRERKSPYHPPRLS